ncbi:MAG: beta-propeller domain-containing protein, partial [Bacillota bacterium]
MRKKSFIYGILIIALIMISSIYAIASNKTEPSSGEIYLYTGSPLILSNGEVKMLDSTNPDLGATIVQSRTLLPLRALSEYFGAEVNYDQAKKEAIIKYDGKQYRFPIGEKKYIVGDALNQKEYPMDSQSTLIDGRTMVPLRVICENVLGKKVSYYDRVIAVAGKEINLQTDTVLVKEVKAKIGEAVKAYSMKELKLALAGGNNVRSFAEDTAFGLSPVSNEKSSSAEATTDSGSSYSTTNTQVAGIDEADVVKTDGKYIYIAGNNVVRIVGTDQGKLSDETAIRLASNKNVSEIFIDDNRLVILGTKWIDTYQKSVSDPVSNEKSAVDSISDEKMIEIVPPYFPTKNYSFMDVYDITNPLKPAFLKGHEMEGSYQSSRKNGEIVYLVTNTYLSGDIILPMMRDTVTGNEEFGLKLNDVMIMPRHPSSGYIVISAMNINNEEKTEVEAITAYGSIMYMNESALYLAVNDNGNTTSIIKFKLQGTKVGYAGSGDVKGYLLNQFSMDEYEGNLRVATTSWKTETENGLYVLNDSLNVTGSVEGIAKGETIYSVRFIGDKGYIVTFRTMDPLFVFDLSDPQKPVITGELEMPGFS